MICPADRWVRGRAGGGVTGGPWGGQLVGVIRGLRDFDRPRACVSDTSPQASPLDGANANHRFRSNRPEGGPRTFGRAAQGDHERGGRAAALPSSGMKGSSSRKQCSVPAHGVLWCCKRDGEGKVEP